jgi:hypothetical protein
MCFYYCGHKLQLIAEIRDCRAGILSELMASLPVECPTKLFYTGKTDVYPDRKREDEFRQALADGGFQVGELAKLMFPGGIEITPLTHDDQVAETERLLQRDNVTRLAPPFATATCLRRWTCCARPARRSSSSRSRQTPSIHERPDIPQCAQRHRQRPGREGVLPSGDKRQQLDQEGAAAVMQSSDYLKRRYSKPIYGAKGGIRSLNFADQLWWQEVDGAVVDLYRLLPPVFTDLPREVVDAPEVNDDLEIAQGGAATTAHARLQFEDVAMQERTSIEAALLRYCELDTLTMVMVMVYEAFLSWS